ncbi:hypothetical protein E8E11_007791 [Didymella keratinophila]|nr:hypothetical protein E8E11_007791 [Didymella keratinophila]
MINPNLAPGLPEFSLKNKVVLVSGAARGLGLTQAEALLEAGAIVYALDRLPEPHPDFHTVAERAKSEFNSKFEYRQIDVRDVDGLHKVVEDIASVEGRMDGLVAAAGIQQETPALEYKAEDANRMFEVNITGVFMTAQAVAKQMIKFGNGGSMAFIASMSGTVANRGLICAAYNSSKAGVIQLARNLASEWGQHNIRVNTISPGYIVTQMVEELFVKYPERKETWPTQNMLGRLSAPKEYRGAAVFLISDASSFMTGQGLHRSNAVRRGNPQRRLSRTTRIISRLESEVDNLGDHTILGLVVPLDPQNLISPNELRDLLVPMVPDASADTIEDETTRLYDIFLDRLLDSGFSRRPLAPAEIEAVTRWVGSRLPNTAAIARAVERRTQRLNDARPEDADGAESVAGTDISFTSDDDTDIEGMDPEGQTLQRTLYHIAEERARQEGVIHRGITCNGCDEKPIRGTRWHCANCVDFDLCSSCEATNSHTRTHVFYKIRVPAPYLSLAKQEPLYPGRPHMMHHSVNSALKRRLVSETRMEVEEIEALWDQFTCLASTEWRNDPVKVGWALDRRAFNHAFVPRYNGFVSAPNLIYDRIFQYYDSDKNGLIGFEEWIKGIDKMHSSDTKVKARIIFDGYDIDGDGYISRRDVLRVFRAYYAIEKEATRNFVAELTEEMSVRNSMDTVRSSQPLGSAFPPNSLPTSNPLHPDIALKQNGTFDESSHVILDTDFESASREEVIRANEISQLLTSSPQKEAGERVVRDAWARREFTLDEEEGLLRPTDADVTDEEEEAEAPETVLAAADLESERTVSQRSSRVHSQDEVNRKDWPNKSSSKKPVNEQRAGYEIPEYEQDLGKEVLYQITQQAFNELLDPLFRAREDMALDARSLRSERRKNTEQIEVLLEREKGWGTWNPIIFHFGVFRYAKSVVDIFSQHLSKGALEALKAYSYKDRENATLCAGKIRRAIAAAEGPILAYLRSRYEKMPSNDIAEWNAELIREQLYEELIQATFWLIDPSGPMKPKVVEPVKPATLPKEPTYDPTMPQFRPNSTMDISAGTGRWLTAIAESFPEAQDGEAAGGSHQSMTASEQEEKFEELMDPEGRICIGPDGPFFVYVRTPDQIQVHDDETVTQMSFAPFREGENDQSESPNEPLPTSADATDPPDSVPSAPRSSRDFSQDDQGVTASPTRPTDPIADCPLDIVIPHVYTDTPWLQHFTLVTTPAGQQIVQAGRRHIVHTTNLYAIQPEPDQTGALITNLRRNAKNPDSPLYTRLLASCEAVEQESRCRKGDGLLSFEEFEEVLEDGRLRFLESWMDWVSL